MEYPREFSTQARARVEAERLKANKQLEQQRKEVPWSQFGPRPADEENLRKYILRVFLVFAQEACKLGSQGQWIVDRIRSEVDELLRRFTIEAYYDKGHDRKGRKLREMVSDCGSILPEVQQEFEKSVEWRQFEQDLLAVAEQQARGSPQSSGRSVGTLSGTAVAGEIKPQAANPQQGFTHSPDYRSVRLEKNPFTLTPKQAAVVQTLDENMLNGTPDVSGERLLEVADSRGSRLRDIFKSNKEAWATLITGGKRKGTYRLNLPEMVSPAIPPEISADSH